MQVFDIVGRRARSDFAIIKYEDFDLRRSAASPDLADLSNLLPYCINVPAERVAYADAPEMATVIDATFLYQAQYEHATKLVSIPFERLAEVDAEQEARPTFVFSLGRCGSTLLASLLRAVAYHPVAEPDIYTNLAVMPVELRRQFGNDLNCAVIRAAIRTFARHCGPDLFIKLRSQCNGIVRDIVSAVPEGRFVFIFRDPVSWAKSRHRTFGDSPRALAGQIKWGIQTYDFLVRSGCQPTLLWYDEIIADAVAVLTRIGVPTSRLDAAALAQLQHVLSTDSQGGTSIARGAFASRRLSGNGLQAFVREWRSLAPISLIERHGLERLLPSAASGHEACAVRAADPEVPSLGSG